MGLKGVTKMKSQGMIYLISNLISNKISYFSSFPFRETFLTSWCPLEM